MKKLYILLFSVLILFITLPQTTFAQSIIVIDISQDNYSESLSYLPETTGDPSNPTGKWGELIDHKYDSTTKKFSFDLLYNDKTYRVKNLILDGDTDFLEKSKKASYFTKNDQRILYFSFGSKSQSEMLKASTAEENQNWEGEALWNLNTGEVNVVDVAHIYHYIKPVDKDGNIFSYFLMPNVEFDSIVSISLTLAYQYQKTGLFGWGGAGDTILEYVTLLQDKTTSVQPAWVNNLYKTAVITEVIAGSALVGIMTYAVIAGVAIPGVGWAVSLGILGVSAIVAMTAQKFDKVNAFAYDVNQLEEAKDLSATDKSNIHAYMMRKNPGLTYTDINDEKIYKLHLATIDTSGSPKVIADQTEITQVVYITNGKVNVINRDRIITDNFGNGTQKTETEQPLKWYEKLSNNFSNYYLILIAGGLLIGGIALNVTADKKKFLIYLIFSVGILLLTGILKL